MRRNHMSPVVMECLQILKYLFKQARLNLASRWSVSATELEQANDAEDLRRHSISSFDFDTLHTMESGSNESPNSVLETEELFTLLSRTISDL
ncbi:hypothetical protein OF83DRAFT_268492 [Amylostereum chailletii]|nr:hypothetical protein OF83DRAFT_268492 [Amylostereum chailletii]